MGSAPSRSHRIGAYVKIDESRTRDFGGSLRFGKIIGVCAAMQRHNYEYTVQIESNETECVEEQYIEELHLPDIEWVNPKTREVAVWVETHGNKKFAADLIRKTADGLYEVRFVADGTLLEKVQVEHLSEPEPDTVRDVSPENTAPDPSWLLDRKIQANIDVFWPMELRIKEVQKRIRQPRPTTSAPLRGPFVGKDAVDSEGYAAHPKPLPDLMVDGQFVDTWGKFAGKVKFASTYRIGPAYPRMDAWVDQIDAGEPLYFHAALPVYAGLICLGTYQGKPEWIRTTDVSLLGIALYANGKLYESSEDPPLEKDGVKKYGHDSCHFIPGCTSTYFIDMNWVGGVFTLAPAESDFEVKDDIHSISAYHQILKDYSRTTLGSSGTERREVTLQVDLVLSTNYLATVRQVCCGAVTVILSDRGMAVAHERIRHVMDYRLHSQAALFAKRPRKALSQESFEEGVVSRLKTSATRPIGERSPTQAALPPPPPMPPTPPSAEGDSSCTAEGDVSGIALGSPFITRPHTAQSSSGRPGSAAQAAASADAAVIAAAAKAAVAATSRVGTPLPPGAPPAPPPLPPPSQPPPSTALPSQPQFAQDEADAPASEESPSLPAPARSGSTAQQRPGSASRRVPASGPIITEPWQALPSQPQASQGEADAPGSEASPPLPGAAAARPGSAARQRPGSASRRMPSSGAIATEPWQVVGGPTAHAPAGSAPPRGPSGRSKSPAGVRAPSPGITAARRRPLMDTGLGGGSQQRSSSRNRLGEG
eukprot:gb/GFBE01042079.1/.p1 GENE.gb/GFBE01042079.1/~~gb/GFBE01042079.1/.p1  ORF type:complete len:765 (+),score=119.75 gb/GFBE01042079.1/:1-2295(+)